MVVLALVNTMWASIGGFDNLLEFLGWKGVSSAGSTIEPSRHGGSEADAGEGKTRWPNAVANVTRDDLIRCFLPGGECNFNCVSLWSLRVCSEWLWLNRSVKLPDCSLHRSERIY